MGKWKFISKYEVISFDIFDTLIKRNVYQPGNIFDCIEVLYSKRYPLKRIDNFRKIRM